MVIDRAESAFGVLYTNDSKAELTVVVTVMICRKAHKHVGMKHPPVSYTHLTLPTNREV